MISERKKYIAKIFLNRCTATNAMRQNLIFHLKLMENSYKLSENDLADLKKIYSVDNYIERLIPLIDEHFTIEEMQEAIRFYSSEVGRKMSDSNFLNKVSNVGTKIGLEMNQKFAIADEQS